MFAVLAFGFLVGMGHALEADHLAAVAAMAADGRSRRGMVIMGALWGAGHTITLFALCTAVLLFGFALTARTTATFEFGVGVMLVLLGLNVLRKMHRSKIHFHVHRHADTPPHLHAHSHRDAPVAHRADPHRHLHRPPFSLRPLLVGLMHGAAGSAALLAFALAAAHDTRAAIFYVLLFGIGSIFGMAALSLAASWPLGLAQRTATWLNRGVTLIIAGFAMALGAHAILAQWPAVRGA